jgi:Domain of unknown function.
VQEKGKQHGCCTTRKKQQEKNRRDCCHFHCGIYTDFLILSAHETKHLHNTFLSFSSHDFLASLHPPNFTVIAGSSWDPTAAANGKDRKGEERRGNSGLNSRVRPITAHLYINDTHKSIQYPQYTGSEILSNGIRPFPVIDDYPEGDAYLPWIHDVFVSPRDQSKIIILAQNKRRCHTGKNYEDTMKRLEPQIALFQPISLKQQQIGVGSNSSTFVLSNDDEATIHETRFQCRFKLYQNDDNKSHKVIHEEIVFSKYPFNYEYITWRKVMDGMFETKGKGMAQFWLSSLEFHCPIPVRVQQKLKDTNIDNLQLYLDVATIQTPVRRAGEWFLLEVGKQHMFDVNRSWGSNIPIMNFENSTQWENIYIPIQQFLGVDIHKDERATTNNKATKDHSKTMANSSTKPFQLVACTWTSAAHNRRGDAVTLKDGKERLKEWITFNRLVGFDHVIVYDNSRANTNATTLKEVTDLFDPKFVTYIDWPCKVCNNNRPAHDDPGERSSQYAAEASCRARFGPFTDWMAFLDPDEYLVPMGNFTSWKEILEGIDRVEQRKVLKFRSTRTRPRLNLLDPTYDPSYSNCPNEKEAADEKKPGISSCLIPRKNETFLKVYNCEYIKSPKPERFQRAMKQLYRPDFVQSHFVHYSTVTTELSMRKYNYSGAFKRAGTNNPKNERFVDEINEGVMIHAKSMTPNDGISRATRCVYKKTMCNIGIECPDDLPFDDKTHRDGFLYGNETYCNCWINRKVETLWIPKLESELKKLYP